MIILHFHLHPQFKYELFHIYFTSKTSQSTLIWVTSSPPPWEAVSKKAQEIDAHYSQQDENWSRQGPYVAMRPESAGPLHQRFQADHTSDLAPLVRQEIRDTKVVRNLTLFRTVDKSFVANIEFWLGFFRLCKIVLFCLKGKNGSCWFNSAKINPEAAFSCLKSHNILLRFLLQSHESWKQIHLHVNGFRAKILINLKPYNKIY